MCSDIHVLISIGTIIIVHPEINHGRKKVAKINDSRSRGLLLALFTVMFLSACAAPTPMEQAGNELVWGDSRCSGRVEQVFAKDAQSHQDLLGLVSELAGQTSLTS